MLHNRFTQKSDGSLKSSLSMEDVDQYMAMAQLLRKLLHPDLSSRATADQALTELELMP